MRGHMVVVGCNHINTHRHFNTRTQLLLSRSFTHRCFLSHFWSLQPFHLCPPRPFLWSFLHTHFTPQRCFWTSATNKTESLHCAAVFCNPAAPHCCTGASPRGVSNVTLQGLLRGPHPWKGLVLIEYNFHCTNFSKDIQENVPTVVNIERMAIKELGIFFKSGASTQP